MSLILASASPRRRDLLREAGYTFDIDPAHVDESEAAGEAPRAYVLRVAALKARAVAARHPRHTVLAADTTVVVDAVMLAKPADDDDARRMLRLLSGRAHVVLTGVVVRAAGGEWSEVAESRVRFRSLTPDEIDWYVATGEPHDKAGAYAVQGLAARFVDAVDGPYSNVVGLPMGAVGELLAAAGVLPEDAARAAAWREPAPFDRTGG
jgi:septum formation protein